jgi:hypothetical protein
VVISSRSRRSTAFESGHRPRWFATIAAMAFVPMALK